MEDLKLHERFEIETLETMRRLKSLDKLIFGGGTMLRLCFGLPRYSVDLDFYVSEGKNFSPDFPVLRDGFKKSGCEISDYQAKHFTYLLEIKSPIYQRKLKIEIRKEPRESMETVINIAYSASAPTLQVRLKTCTLKQMWKNKVSAFLDRGALRDAFDLEFLLRRNAGSLSDISKTHTAKMLETLNKFNKRDFANTLGNLLPPKEREFCASNQFALLKSELANRINS